MKAALIVLASFLSLHVHAYDHLHAISKSNPIRVSIAFRGTNSPQIESSFRRGVRTFDDVTVTDEKPDLRIDVLLLAVLMPSPEGPHLVGWAASVLVVRPEDFDILDIMTNKVVGVELVNSLKNSSFKDDVTVEVHSAMIIPADKVREGCDALVALIDQDVFENCRKSAQWNEDDQKKRQREAEPGSKRKNGP